MQKLKALEILKEKKKILVGLYNGDDYSDEIDNFAKDIKELDEAIEELEQYEQNFKQKEFDYRTKCQNILSSDRLSKDKNLSNLVNHAIEQMQIMYEDNYDDSRFVGSNSCYDKITELLALIKTTGA